MPTHGRSRGSLEQEILACLGAADGPRSVQQVRDDVDPGLAYTTVMTTLSRLHAKKAVQREQSGGRAFRYSLPGGADAARASITAHSMHRLLAAGEDRGGVLSKFVAELSPADEDILRRALGGGTDGIEPPAGTGR